MAGYVFFKDTRPAEKQLERTSRSKIIMVEGPDECLMFDKMLQTMGADPAMIEIIPYLGKQKFEKNLGALVRQDVFQDDSVRGLAIFQDADQSIVDTKKNISASMATHGFPNISFGSFTNGRRSSNIMYGAFVFPNNQAEGNLETLLISTVHGSAAMQEANDYVAKHMARMDKDDAKRKAQVYLSVQRNLCRGAGQGARDGYFDLSHAECTPLVDFIQAFIAI